MKLIDPAILEIFLRLLIATGLGMLLGLERVLARKTAGMRTYGLASMGAALFVIVSEIVVQRYAGMFSIDPLRMASQVVVGIGFIGAGLIIFRGSEISGITTTVGLWVSTGIGMATGFGLYSIAVFTAVLTLFVFTAVWFIEDEVKKRFDIHKKRKDVYKKVQR